MSIIETFIASINTLIDVAVRKALTAALPYCIALRYAEKAKAASQLGMVDLANHYMALAKAMLNQDV